MQLSGTDMLEKCQGITEVSSEGFGAGAREESGNQSRTRRQDALSDIPKEMKSPLLLEVTTGLG